MLNTLMQYWKNTTEIDSEIRCMLDLTASNFRSNSSEDFRFHYHTTTGEKGKYHVFFPQPHPIKHTFVNKDINPRAAMKQTFHYATQCPRKLLLLKIRLDVTSPGHYYITGIENIYLYVQYKINNHNVI